MKTFNSLILIYSLVLTGCFVTNQNGQDGYKHRNIDYNVSFWGELESNEAFLLMGDSLTSIAKWKVDKGTILLFKKKRGEFYEVYTQYPLKFVRGYSDFDYRFYIYRPEFIKLGKYDNEGDNVKSIPFGFNNYFTGERGGCYFVNDNGLKVYVIKTMCSGPLNTRTEKRTKAVKPATTNYFQTTTKPASSSTKCRTVQCSGSTKKDLRCKRKTTNCSGRCYQH